MKASPAPTVSATSTRTGAPVTRPARVTARAPSAPSVTKTAAGPSPSQRRATSPGGSPGYSQARSSSLALTRSLSATHRSTWTSVPARAPSSAGRMFGS